jgi:hypothetical protein
MNWACDDDCCVLGGFWAGWDGGGGEGGGVGVWLVGVGLYCGCLRGPHVNRVLQKISRRIEGSTTGEMISVFLRLIEVALISSRDVWRQWNDLFKSAPVVLLFTICPDLRSLSFRVHCLIGMIVHKAPAWQWVCSYGKSLYWLCIAALSGPTAVSLA